MIDDFKVCKACGVTKDMKDFSPLRYKVRPNCKKCHSEITSARLGELRAINKPEEYVECDTCDRQYHKRYLSCPICRRNRRKMR